MVTWCGARGDPGRGLWGGLGGRGGLLEGRFCSGRGEFACGCGGSPVGGCSVLVFMGSLAPGRVQCDLLAPPLPPPPGDAWVSGFEGPRTQGVRRAAAEAKTI